MPPPTGPIHVSGGDYSVAVDTSAPALLRDYRQHADLHEHFELDRDREPSGFLFVSITKAADTWPGLVVTQRCSPAGVGFHPGVVLLDDGRVFIGAGTRLLAYHRPSGTWQRQWIDEAELGFWGWRRHGDVVVMSAELELAAWTTGGQKLWSTFVEPPWSYVVVDQHVHLDVMGTPRVFPLRGPAP